MYDLIYSMLREFCEHVLNHFVLSWLTKDHAVNRESAAKICQPIHVAAERDRRDVSLDGGTALVWEHPKRNKFASLAVAIRFGSLERSLPAVNKWGREFVAKLEGHVLAYGVSFVAVDAALALL